MTRKKQFRVGDMVLCALFTTLIAVGAFIRIPLPVMPFTLQFLFTNLAGILLGRRLGAMAAGVYVILGLIGLPVFTGGGGIGYVLQPTFGYLLGFIGGAWLAGYLVERFHCWSFRAVICAGAANLAVVYSIGTVYYYCIVTFYMETPIGVGTLLIYCIALAIPGDLLLCVSAGLLARRLNPLLIRN